MKRAEVEKNNSLSEFSVNGRKLPYREELPLMSGDVGVSLTVMSSRRIRLCVRREGGVVNYAWMPDEIIEADGAFGIPCRFTTREVWSEKRRLFCLGSGEGADVILDIRKNSLSWTTDGINFVKLVDQNGKNKEEVYG